MRQVPRYLLIGRGRLAQHWQHYFELLGIVPLSWHRGSPESLEALLQAADVVLVLISDDAISKFIEPHLGVVAVKWIHCSGSLSLEGVTGLHPLMTFTETPYELLHYRAITLICDDPDFDFKHCFPLLENPVYHIPKKDKAFYHALCVMSGNFTVILWQKFFNEAERRWGLPQEAITPYLNAIAKNIEQSPDAALTGPIARGDYGTIQKNIDALEHDPFRNVYQAVLQAYEENNYEVD